MEPYGRRGEAAVTELSTETVASAAIAIPSAETSDDRLQAQRLPLAMRGIHKQWKRTPAPCLADVDLDLDLGTRTWVGGRNGAGKTTLMRIAAGLIRPDRGWVGAWGNAPDERRQGYYRLVAFLPAGDRGLYARLTVRRQLHFWAGIAMLDPSTSTERVEQAIERFQLTELADRRVDRMSMGQRQRLRIAMTFLPGPEIVLLDEPLTSLDDEGAALLESAIDELIVGGGTMLWCSPSGDHPEIDFDADWLLENGRLVRQ
jgi:ABC-2 type transport system ATP-binding protein